MKEPTSSTEMSRRDFLKAGGAGLFVFFVAGDLLLFSGESEGAPLPRDFNAFLKIGEDGRVTCFSGKIEMGQGVITSLAQMLADELDVAFASVDMVLGDTDRCPYDSGTYGSLTTRVFGPALRQAGAEARSVLLRLATKRLDVDYEALAAADGWVFVEASPERRVSYGELTRGRRLEHFVKGDVRPKEPARFNLMNKPLRRADARLKVTGAARYAGDITLPGMLRARILRPPAHGARLVELDTSAAEKIAGVRVVRDGELIAVLHEKWDVADAALSALEARWQTDPAKVDTDSIFDHLLAVAPSGTVLNQGGSLKDAQSEDLRWFDSTFLDGYVAHAPMEPHTATVEVKDGRATVWPSSQTPFPAREEAAAALGLPAERVRVVSPFLGGGFGGKTRNLQVVEAARLARICERPVQVAWSREDEFFHDSFRPAAVVKVRSGLDSGGRIRAWDYHVYFAGDRGAEQFYAIPDHRTLSHGSLWGVAPGVHPFAVGAWRAPANNTNTFARESQIDIMAAAAGVDPLEFRLRHLEDDKARRVLEAVAQRSSWRQGRGEEGFGRGLACGRDAGTWVATVAEVKVDRASGTVTVTRVVCAQDMGLCVNPEGATIQMEGCITMGLGYALSEELFFRGGEVLDRNFDTYEIPRFSWLPEIDTVIVDDVGAPPQGGGEPAIVTMGAALANAIYDACGVRLYRLPMTGPRLKEALAAAGDS